MGPRRGARKITYNTQEFVVQVQLQWGRAGGRGKSLGITFKSV